MIDDDGKNEIDTLRTENETLKQQLKEMEEKVKLMSLSKPKKLKNKN